MNALLTAQGLTVSVKPFAMEESPVVIARSRAWNLTLVTLSGGDCDGAALSEEGVAPPNKWATG